MNSKNVNNYENVVIRKEQEIGINNFGLEYLVSLEQEIERLNKDLKDACEVIERLKEDKKKAIKYIEENCGADNRLALKLILRGDKE